MGFNSKTIEQSSVICTKNMQHALFPLILYKINKPVLTIVPVILSQMSLLVFKLFEEYPL